MTEEKRYQKISERTADYQNIKSGGQRMLVYTKKDYALGSKVSLDLCI